MNPQIIAAFLVGVGTLLGGGAALFSAFTKPEPSVCKINETKVGGSVIMNCGNSGSTRYIMKIAEINPQRDLEQN